MKAANDNIRPMTKERMDYYKSIVGKTPLWYLA